LAQNLNGVLQSKARSKFGSFLGTIPSLYCAAMLINIVMLKLNTGNQNCYLFSIPSLLHKLPKNIKSAATPDTLVKFFVEVYFKPPNLLNPSSKTTFFA